jgi:deoxynucleoside kinase
MDLAALLQYILLVFSSPQKKDHSPGLPLIDTPTKPFTILVEGNVGAGKSTFLKYFENRTGIILVPEPVEKWQNISGTDLLAKLYQDGRRWSGAFQLYSTLTRIQDSINSYKAAEETALGEKLPQRQQRQRPIRIMERSIYSGRYCFLESLRGDLTAAEFAVIDKWFNMATAKLAKYIKPDLIVHLRSDVSTLVERIRHRGRQEEAVMDENFLIATQQNHDDWLFYQNTTFPVPAKVVTITHNGDIESFFEKVKSREHEILPTRY